MSRTEQLETTLRRGVYCKKQLNFLLFYSKQFNWRDFYVQLEGGNPLHPNEQQGHNFFFGLLSHKEQKFHTNIKYISEKLWGDKTSSYTTFQGSKFKHYQRYSR